MGFTLSKLNLNCLKQKTFFIITDIQNDETLFDVIDLIRKLY